MRRRCNSRIALMIVLFGLAQINVLAQEPAVSPFRELLAVAEWTPERFEQFADDQPLNEAAQAELARLLLRMRSIPRGKLAEWAQRPSKLDSLAGDSAELRGELYHLSGQLVAITKQPLEDNAAKALDQPDWFICEIQVSGNQVEVITASVPDAWLQLQPLDQPVACDAVFLRRVKTGDGSSRAQLAIPHIAWYPVRPQPPEVNFGMATLGSLGVDMAEWDSLRGTGALKSEDFTAFYATLAAMRELEGGELLRMARENLSDFVAPYRKELAQFGEETRATRRGTVLRTIVADAGEGRYSSWPLFLEADRQRGQLFAFEGVVRRAVRIETAVDREGNVSDAVKRFGIDHYYEIELFPGDSQNLPLVFCVLELPEGFPTGDDLHEPARVAGFFFKTWLYHGQQTAGSSATENLRKAPLLIGRGPLQIVAPANESNAVTSAIAGGLLTLAIVGVWLAAWWFGRSNRHFEQSTLARLKAKNEPVRIEIPSSIDG